MAQQNWFVLDLKYKLVNKQASMKKFEVKKDFGQLITNYSNQLVIYNPLNTKYSSGKHLNNYKLNHSK